MMKKFSLTIMVYVATLSGAASVYGQGSVVRSFGAEILTYIYNNMFLFLVIGVLLGVVAVSFKLIWAFIDNQKLKLADQLGAISIDQPSVRSQEKSFLQKLYDKAWNIAPKGKEAEIVLDHDYDGIKELDNSLPPWWVWLFYGTIIFSGAYLWYYNISSKGPNQLQEYEISMEVAELQKAQQLSNQGNMIDETSVVALTDEADIAEGKEIYITNCAVCHGHEGEGLVGPNFTDKYWIHGGSVNNIFSVIKYGVPEKGMISWKDQLRPAAIQKVSSYILTFQGTNPPNQKEKEGELYEPKVEVVAPEKEAAPEKEVAPQG